MAGFNILSDINDSGAKKVPISSITVTIGDLLELVGGATTWTACTATSAHFNRKAIAMENATTAATEVLVQELTGTETVEVDVTNTAAAADNGDLMVLTDKDTVNNTHTTSTTEYACFIQDKPGKTTTKIIGRVLVGNGVNPDATT
jgi:hypothetical protein